MSSLQTDDQDVRTFLRSATDAASPALYAPAPAAVVGLGAQRIRRRRLAVAGSAFGAAAVIAIGATAVGGGFHRADLRPARTTSSAPEVSSVGVQDPNTTDGPDLTYDVTTSLIGSARDVKVAVTDADLAVHGTATFGRSAIDTGGATAWLDPHTLVVAMPAGSQSQVLTTASDNTGSGTVEMPRTGVQIDVMSFRESMGDLSTVGVVWRDPLLGWHATTNAKVTHLRIGDGPTTADYWASEMFDSSGVFTRDGWSMSFWRVDGYQPALRNDDQSTGRTTYVVETQQATDLLFAADAAKPDLTVPPTSVAKEGSVWWAVFEVATSKVGKTSTISWPQNDGTTFRGTIP